MYGVSAGSLWPESSPHIEKWPLRACIAASRPNAPSMRARRVAGSSAGTPRRPAVPASITSAA